MVEFAFFVLALALPPGNEPAASPVPPRVYGFGLPAQAQQSRTDKPVLQEPAPRRRKRDWLYHGLEVNYALLNALDLVTTFSSLAHGAREANPVAGALLRNKPAAVLIKGGITGGVLFALRRVKQHDSTLAYTTLGFLNVVYGVVVAHNFGVYFRLK